MQLDVFKLELCLRNYIEANIKIGCIILNGGTTNEIIIDPIKEVVDLRDKLVKEYNLDYIPHIHVDSVIGFAWLFFKKYDFSKNKFNMNSDELKKIKSMKNKISQLKYADSFGADFHKTGFCPYISSIFMAKNYDDITSLGNKKNNGIENMKFGEYSPFEYTLELTRSSIGPVSAYVALETFGVEGFQRLIYKLFSNGEYIRDRLNNLNDFEVINMDTEGIATLFIIRKNDDNRKYSDIINEPSDEIIEFVDYNHQFYLFSLKNFEKNKINFKMTFSKSYKPYGCSHQTGCLKLYPTSPLTTKKDIDKIINQMYELKKQYDNSNERLIEDIDAPIDYVFR